MMSKSHCICLRGHAIDLRPHYPDMIVAVWTRVRIVGKGFGADPDIEGIGYSTEAGAF